MSGPTRSPDGRDEQPPGVLGNLPRSRPGLRSPRRGDPDPSAPEAAEARSAAQGERASPSSSPSDPSPGDLEALARVGIGVAGAAVSVGLRLAVRAAGGVRDAIERR